MKLKKYHYNCPKCNERISTENVVHFKIADPSKKKGSLYLSGVPGEYNYAVDGIDGLKKGVQYEFFCPSCNQNLQSSKYPSFVEVVLAVSFNCNLNIYFSPVFGDMKTLVFMNDNFFTNSYHFPTWNTEAYQNNKSA